MNARMRMIFRHAAAAMARSPVRRSLVAAASMLAFGVLGVQAQNFTPRDEAPEEFPAGRGRDETFYACTACHGFKLVAQQGLNRRQWEESLDWMSVKHGMSKLDTADRKVVLDYLEATYPPRAPAGRASPNPFLKP